MPMNGLFCPDEAIAQRRTNRRLYDGRNLSHKTLEQLRADTPGDDEQGIVTEWIGDRSQLNDFAQLVGRADAAMFSEPSMRRAFLSNVRFDAPANKAVDEGLPIGSLEISRADRVAFRVMPYMPAWAFHALRVGRVFECVAKRLVESASGVCVVIAPSRRNDANDIDAGRCVQRAWLALTRAGFAVQPMMSLAVLDNVLDHGSDELVRSMGRGKLLQFRAQLRSLLTLGPDGRLAFLLRFGFAPAPSARTGRLPVERVTEVFATAPKPLVSNWAQ
jgi:hypothetical protein